jgi:hypothetical protein
VVAPPKAAVTLRPPPSGQCMECEGGPFHVKCDECEQVRKCEIGVRFPINSMYSVRIFLSLIVLTLYCIIFFLLCIRAFSCAISFSLPISRVPLTDYHVVSYFLLYFFFICHPTPPRTYTHAQFLCNACDESVHSKGARTRHVRKPVDASGKVNGVARSAAATIAAVMESGLKVCGRSHYVGANFYFSSCFCFECVFLSLAWLGRRQH